MAARSLIEEMRGWYATAVRGEVSDADVRGYLRAASQIEDVWREVDERLARSIAGGLAPWEAYARLRYPLAYVRAARTYEVFVRELLEADAAFGHITAGYLPPVTYDQANGLCHQILPNLQHAIAALHDERYEPDEPFPMELGPRVEAEGHACPPPHLAGILAAAREVREWAAGLIAEYANAAAAAKAPAPAEIAAHIEALEGRLAQADSQLRFGTDLVGQVTEGEATPELHERAEDALWDALQAFFLLNQAAAMPELLRTPEREAAVAPAGHRHGYRDRRVRPRDLWRLAAPSARGELQHTTFGEAGMEALCAAMGGVLPAAAQRYLDEAKAAEARGDVRMIAAMADCPFEPLYRARRPVDLAGEHVPAGHEFHWNFRRGRVEISARFRRVEEWREREG